ncbi:Inner membrane ABC transporter permease protein YdcV [Pseudooceanicola marinus]|uniref:Inner membrane ABC transporter permease protein YdcV n=1 Tax=Pseudooceanicola marinus TaxID=396013 RepID=A0A1X6YGK9_9RHOB|nr:ABC transporter permease [Pseudooceanicola marinus]PJE26475.1 ABC transporter permease [Pseudooceanicola marinus]SLN21080.1 Inner membrane ABC transporter permease protein YdcV [Pseudooceanicola marinus]
MQNLSPRRLLLMGYVYAVLFFVLAPIVIILPMAFSETDYLTFPPVGFTLSWFTDFFSNSRWMGATVFSLKIAVLTAITTSVVATMATYALMRGAGRIGALFQGLLIAPIVVPHIALAVALYLFFQRIGLSSTVFGYVLAHSVIAMPFAVFTVSAALSAVDATLEDAAMSCGASRFTAFRLVTLPMILPNVLSGGLFAFILSFDEPVIAFFLAGIRDKTLPRMMFDDIEQNLTPIIPAIAVLLTAVSIFALIAAALLRRAAANRTAPEEAG